MRMKLTLTLLFSLIALLSKAQEMKTYTDEKTNTSIKYPVDWTYQENPSTVFILMRPLEEPKQIFKENVNLIINDGQGLNLQEYVGVAKVQMRNNLVNYTEISTEYLELGGRKYARIIYQHNPQNLPLKVAYYLTIHNGKSYNLTCSTTQQNFEKYLPVFQEMIQSFKIE